MNSSYKRHEQSSQIHSSAYDGDTQQLFIRFNCPSCKGNGKAEGSEFGCEKCAGTGFSSSYVYDAVPAEVAAKVREAESVGSAFHQAIKKGGYAYKRLG